MTQTSQPWTVKRLLEWTSGFLTRKQIDPPRLSAEMLLAHVLSVPRIKLYTDYERVLSEADLAKYRELIRRASENEPIAYLTGRAPFFNLEFEVSPDVLIPRPDTETLVENVLQLARRTIGFESPRILDLCTGSGCIAAAIAHHNKNASVVAVDISETAIAIAKKNIDRLALTERVTLLQGDLFAPLAQLIDHSQFDLIVSNPPYIPSGQIASLDRSVAAYEPHLALDGGIDGLEFHRRIFTHSPAKLRSAGRIFLEIAFDQGAAAMQIAAAANDFEQPMILKDHAGNDRVLSAMKK